MPHTAGAPALFHILDRIRIMYKDISDEAFNLAMKSLERDFGGRFAEKGLQENEYVSIPTGHSDLDSILTCGDGGIFVGGVCEIFGNEGGGKCLVRDTLCLTPKGFMTIEQIFEKAGCRCDSARGFVEAEVELINGNLEAETTSHFYKNGYGTNLNTICIVTKDGFVLEGTPNHPVLVMNDQGFVVWRQLGSLQKDEFVCISRNMRVWNKGESISSDEATFLGYLVAEGSLSKLPKSFQFTNTDSDMVALYLKSLNSSLGEDAAQSVKKYGADYQLPRKKYAEVLSSKYGFQPCRAAEKTIPACVLQASKEAQMSFIRAYFDGDGTLQKEKPNLQFCSASLELLRTLQLMLLNFGIYSHITSFYNKTYCRDYYELELAGVELKKYCDEIGFNKNKKCDKIVDVLNDRFDRDFNTNIDVIPNQRVLLDSLYSSLSPTFRTRKTYKVFNDLLVGSCELTYPRLLKILDVCESVMSLEDGDSLLEHSKEKSQRYSHELPLLGHFHKLKENNFVYSSVASIEKSKNRTYDFTLPETHSFWSNGMISHNSSLAMRTVGQAQKLGLHCAWVDVERSFTNELARLNGVNTESLVQIDLLKGKDEDIEFLNIDEVLDKVFKTVWCGVFSLVVVDSVAAFMSERVADSNFDPNKKGMGEEARAMSLGLKRIVPACAEKECTVIFINQVRAKIGEMYGNPETTPGGRALKFYSNQRISVHKSSSKKALIYHKDPDGNEELAGHYSNVRVVKNRKNKPYYDALEIPIYYKEYFPDNAKLCYDLARKLQVITVRNNTVTWKYEGNFVHTCNGESEMLSFIRGIETKEPKEIFLAHCCVEAEVSDKNQNRKVPIKVPSVITKLAESYLVKPQKSSEKPTKKSGSKKSSEKPNKKTNVPKVDDIKDL